MIGLIVGAATLGIIISVMEEGEFPEWISMVICVLATSISTGVVNALLPPTLFFVDPVPGAVCGGFVISATCGMSVKRAVIAAGIYLAIRRSGISCSVGSGVASAV